MCKFKSALVTRTGEVLLSEYTDAHEDLIAYFKLKDDRDPGDGMRPFIRIEFVPSEQIDNPKRYRLKVDEEVTPIWFGDDMQASVTEKMREYIRKMIVPDNRDILLGGEWILTGNAIIKKTEATRIYAMLGSSRVGEMRGSSKVGAMLGSSRVGEDKREAKDAAK
jgi:hypothetical protein